MQPVCELTTARTELNQLRQLQETLSTDLARHASQLKSFGALPPDELIDGLIAFRIRLINLKNAAQVGPESDVSLECVQAAITRSELQDRAFSTLNSVLALRHLDDPHFAGLIDCHSSAARLKSQLETEAISESDRELISLSDGSHPFRALLQIVNAADDLSDHDWATYQEQISATWGRALATAVVRRKIRSTEPAASDSPDVVSPPSEATLLHFAGADEPVVVCELPHDDSANIHADFAPRSIDEQADDTRDAQPSAPSLKFISGDEQLSSNDTQSLMNPPDEESAIPEPSTPATPLATVGWDLLDDSIAEESVFNTNQDSIFDSIGDPATNQSLRRNSRSLDLKLLSEDPYHWARSQPIRTASQPASAPSTGNVGILARRALQADPASRRTMMSQVTLQLLWDDRAALAYHLTRNTESSLQGEAYILPSWVMHALALSRHLCYSKGEIARLLEEDLKQFKPELLNSSSPEWNAGTGFFLRAAALIPALLASSPSAGMILRSFRITPGLSHLYNYCSRVLTYGQQLHGQAADLFTPDCDLAKWQGEMDALQQTVETWLPETIKKYAFANRTSLLFLHAHWTLTASPTMRHPEAVRLWSKWQEVFRIVAKLLKPISTGQETERNWVKAEIDRLTQSVRLESAASEVTTTSALGVITFPQEQMLAMIREAIDYASRWLRLCASKPAQGRTLASRDAELLRDEILDRTDGVINELAAYARSHDSARTKAGIACLCRTIEHLRAIFSPHSTLALRENDPRHVISGELLKIPHLRFNDQWIPAIDSVTLETEVLSHLSHDQRDWRQAFELHSGHHDHLATGRILELNVWRNEQERQALAQRRQTEIDDCRTHLNSEVDALAQHLTATVGRQILSDQVQASLTQRLQRIQIIAAQTVDFSEVHREVQALRLAIDQRIRDVAQASKPARPAGIDRSVSAHTLTHKADPSDTRPPTNNGWAWDVFSDS